MWALDIIKVFVFNFNYIGNTPQGFKKVSGITLIYIFKYLCVENESLEG